MGGIVAGGTESEGLGLLDGGAVFGEAAFLEIELGGHATHPEGVMGGEFYFQDKPLHTGTVFLPIGSTHGYVQLIGVLVTQVAVKSDPYPVLSGQFVGLTLIADE